MQKKTLASILLFKGSILLMGTDPLPKEPTDLVGKVPTTRDDLTLGPPCAA